VHDARSSSESLDEVVLRAPTLAIAEFQRRGRLRVELGVDAESTTGAVRLYERAGMQAVQRWDIWERTA
jgi:hypothetical protein